MSLLFLVFFLINLTVAQRPVPCTSPPQWEARIYSVNEQQQFIVSARMTYDAIYQRVRILEDIRVGTGESYYNVIRLFQAKLEFSVDMKTGNCSRKTLERPWRDIGMLPGAQNLGEAYVGSSGTPGSGLLVTLWRGNETFSQNRTVSYLQAWSNEGCLPVSDTTYDPTSGFIHSSFYDVTAGISDPNVFIPPRQCLSASEYSRRYVLFGHSLTNTMN